MGTDDNHRVNAVYLVASIFSVPSGHQLGVIIRDEVLGVSREMRR